jgi:trigger factor
MTIIDFDGSVDGVPFEGGKAENHSLTLGSGSFIPGFEEQIVGHVAGDEFDVSVKFPEEYTPELAGADAVFKVKLHEIKVKELPELDDDFAKDVGEDYETVADLKKGVRATLKPKNKARLTRRLRKPFSPRWRTICRPKSRGNVCQKGEENTRSFEQRLQQQGIDLQTYLMYFGSDREMFDAQMLEQAKKQVALQLALEKVAELEGITADEADFEAEYAKLAEMYGMEADKLKGFLTQETLAPKSLSKKRCASLWTTPKRKPPRRRPRRRKRTMSRRARRKTGEKTRREEAGGKEGRGISILV